MSDYSIREAKHGSEHGMILDKSHVKGKDICYSCIENENKEDKIEKKPSVLPDGVMTTWAKDANSLTSLHF